MSAPALEEIVGMYNLNWREEDVDNWCGAYFVEVDDDVVIAWYCTGCS